MGGQENKLREGYDYFLSLRLYSKNNPHPSHPAWMRVTFLFIFTFFFIICKMKDILLTANWSNAETFYKFYHKKVVKDKDFAYAVLQ